MQRLTATIDQVVNRLNYTLKIINNDKTKIIANKMEYHKLIIDILKEKKVEFYTYQPRQQREYRVVIRNLQHSVQQEFLREYTERMGTKLETHGHWLSLVTLLLRHRTSSQQQRNIPHRISINLKVQIEPPHQKQNNIQCKSLPSALPYQGVLCTQTNMREMWPIT
jgi:hypothetical protein